jgi:hypothetical protein
VRARHLTGLSGGEAALLAELTLLTLLPLLTGEAASMAITVVATTELRQVTLAAELALLTELTLLTELALRCGLALRCRLALLAGGRQVDAHLSGALMIATVGVGQQRNSGHTERRGECECADGLPRQRTEPTGGRGFRNGHVGDICRFREVCHLR